MSPPAKQARQLFAVFFKPEGEFFLGHFIGGDVPNHLRRLGLGCYQALSVSFQKNGSRHKSGALVPIQKGMVADDAAHIGGGQYKKVGFAVRSQLFWTGQGGIQEVLVPYSGKAAVFKKKFFLDGQNHAF